MSLWARLRNGTVDRLESHRQLGLTLFDGYYRLTRDKNKKWSPETTQKTGRHRKAKRVGIKFHLNQAVMKKFNAIIFCLLTIALLSSCDSNKKLEQADAENAIKEFVQSNSFGSGGTWGQQGSFNVNSIMSIDPIVQFTESEANSLVHFNYRDAFADSNMILKFNFKRNIDKQWVLTSVAAVNGVGSTVMSEKIEKWQNINILVQKRIKNIDNDTSLGADIKYLTLKKVNDIDGNVYHSVTIGTQVWMVENLKTTKYNDGTDIPNLVSNAQWKNGNNTGYCWYNNDNANKNLYGALYNWHTVNTGKLAPKGWHVATDAEWTTLTTFLGGTKISGSKMKEAGATHWSSPNLGATNSSGFSALPGGVRGSDGTFDDIGASGFWWSASESSATAAYDLMVYLSWNEAIKGSADKLWGLSVRCVKD